jgi:RHS repeat-associated protein
MAQRTARSRAPANQEGMKSPGRWIREPHVRHRDYSPTLGRFNKRDPIGFEAGDNNWYRFVANGPMGKLDPSGLKSWCGIARILGKHLAEEAATKAAKSLATELLERLSWHPPNSPYAAHIIHKLKQMGWVEEPLGKGGKKGLPIAEGGGIIFRELVDGKPTDSILQWSPGSRHHGNQPYWKFSSGPSGTLHYIGGTICAAAMVVIPGAEQAAAGDWNGAARQAAYEASPIGWGSWITSYFSWLYDWASHESNSGKPGTIKF